FFSLLSNAWRSAGDILPTSLALVEDTVSHVRKCLLLILEEATAFGAERIILQAYQSKLAKQTAPTQYSNTSASNEPFPPLKKPHHTSRTSVGFCEQREQRKDFCRAAGDGTQTPPSSPDPFSRWEIREGVDESGDCVQDNLCHLGGHL